MGLYLFLEDAKVGMRLQKSLAIFLLEKLSEQLMVSFLRSHVQAKNTIKSA